MMRLLASLVLMILFFAPGALYAQETIPEYNPVCWQKKECVEARRAMMRDIEGVTETELQEGWLEKEAPCNADGWGKCLPGGQTVTQISFGGKNKFRHIGDLILTVYNLALSVASIIAVGVFILAGFQWVTSAGNSEAVMSAKHRMAGAMMGLFLAFCSYFILNAVNPALVSLRLPQIWMVRAQHLVPQFCSAAPMGSVFAYVKPSSEQMGDIKPTGNEEFKFTYANPPKDPSDTSFYCGNRLFLKDGGSRACYGDVCPNNGLCVDFGGKDANNPYHCLDNTVVAGKIVYQPLIDPSCLNGAIPLTGRLTEGWVKPLAVTPNKHSLIGLCKDGKGEVSTAQTPVTIQGKDVQYYSITSNRIQTVEQAESQCAKYGGLAGFVLIFHMDEACDPTDETHYIGRNGIDLGDDVFFKQNRQNIVLSPEYLIPSSSIKAGLILNIDATRIYDMDEDKDYTLYNGLK